MIVDIARNFPKLRFMACHFGGFRRLDEAEKYVVGLPIVLETSWPPGLAEIPTERLRAIVHRHGPDRIIFGSDWPMVDPADEIEAIRRSNSTRTTKPRSSAATSPAFSAWKANLGKIRHTGVVR